MAQKLIKIVLAGLVVACFSALATNASSQPGPTPQQRRQLQAQIERLKQRIQQVEQLLQAFDSNIARGFLQDAKKLGQQIENEFRQGRYMNVQALIRSANNTLDRILAIATDGTLKRLVNELNRVMRQAEFEVLGGGNSEAERILQSAKKLQEQAEQSLQAGKIQKAYEHLTVAITYAKQALDLVRNTCQREHAQFQNLVGRAKNAIDSAQNEQARKIYDQAFKSFTLAEQACREGQTQAAAQLYNRAMRLLLRAVDLTSTGSTSIDEAFLEQELSTVREMLISMKSRVELAEQSRDQVLLRRAEENVNKAEALFAAGRHGIAKVQLALARRLLENVLRTGAPAGDDLQEKAESELRLLQQDLARFETAMPADNPILAEYLSYARQAATRAERAIAAGRYGPALQRILVGQKLLARAENNKMGRPRPHISEQLVQNSLDELRQRLSEAETALSDTPSDHANELLDDAKAMLSQAENKRREGKLRLALELSEIGKELITTALRISQSHD